MSSKACLGKRDAPIDNLPEELRQEIITYLAEPPEEALHLNSRNHSSKLIRGDFVDGEGGIPKFSTIPSPTSDIGLTALKSLSLVSKNWVRSTARELFKYSRVAVPSKRPICGFPPEYFAFKCFVDTTRLARYVEYLTIHFAVEPSLDGEATLSYIDMYKADKLRWWAEMFESMNLCTVTIVAPPTLMSGFMDWSIPTGIRTKYSMSSCPLILSLVRDPESKQAIFRIPEPHLLQSTSFWSLVNKKALEEVLFRQAFSKHERYWPLPEDIEVYPSGLEGPLANVQVNASLAYVPYLVTGPERFTLLSELPTKYNLCTLGLAIRSVKHLRYSFLICSSSPFAGQRIDRNESFDSRKYGMSCTPDTKRQLGLRSLVGLAKKLVATFWPAAPLGVPFVILNQQTGENLESIDWLDVDYEAGRLAWECVVLPKALALGGEWVADPKMPGVITRRR